MSADINRITELTAVLLSSLGEDPSREGLRDTPSRVAKAWADWTRGYAQDPAAILKVFEDGAEKYDQMVFQGGIPVYSHCEHHMAPFMGVAHIAYVPAGKVVGLSKLSRLVDIYAKRLQVQERLTQQIASALFENLAPQGVAVVLECRHMCMESRGIQRIGTTTTTAALHGCFRSEPETRTEFYQLVNRERA